MAGMISSEVPIILLKKKRNNKKKINRTKMIFDYHTTYDTYIKNELINMAYILSIQEVLVVLEFIGT